MYKEDLEEDELFKGKNTKELAILATCFETYFFCDSFQPTYTIL
jgi:hypothetical protein